MSTQAYKVPGKDPDKLPRMQGPSGYFGEPVKPMTRPYVGDNMSQGLTRQAGKNNLQDRVKVNMIEELKPEMEAQGELKEQKKEVEEEEIEEEVERRSPSH